jgi:hypothetical protein
MSGRIQRGARRLGRWLGIVFAVALALIVWQWKSDLPLEQLKARWATGASRFVEVDGLDVHYRDEGTGPPIVLLHGTGASLHTWEAWVEVLSASHRVVRLDLPGFGLTGPNPRGDYRIDATSTSSITSSSASDWVVSRSAATRSAVRSHGALRSFTPTKSARSSSSTRQGIRAQWSPCSHSA